MTLISRFMVDEIAISRRIASANEYGDSSYDAIEVIKARVEEVLESVRGVNGEDLNVSNWIAIAEYITEKDRVWTAPDGPNGSPRIFPIGYVFNDADARSPKKVANARRREGTHGHTEFYL